jgi:iron(III) transport system substrate-binding protein
VNKSALTHRRMNRRRRMLAPLAALTAAATLAACGGGGEEAASAPENKISVESVPDYYPEDYQELIDASKEEGGELEIYSNTDQENWEPIFRDFQKKFPWVETLNANNLDSDEVFQRVLSENATGGSPADILVSNAAQAWAEFGEDPSRIMAYESPELGQLPEFAEVMDNVYAFSMDPIVIPFNTSLIPEEPKGHADLARIVSENPEQFQNQLTTRDIGGAFGFTVAYNLMQGNPDLWEAMETLLPLARPETSSGTQIEKIVAGEYVAGINISAAPTYPVLKNSDGLIDVVFAEDGTVVLPRAISIAPDAPHSATAKLFLDFVLSEEGQAAVAEGGLTSYRDSVEAAEGRHTYQEVVDAVGEENVIIAPYELISEEEIASFTERWNGLLGG